MHRIFDCKRHLILLVFTILVVLSTAGGAWQSSLAIPAAFFSIEVDTNLDNNSLDDCTGPIDDDCSLRGAISYANATVAGSEIEIVIPTGDFILSGASDENSNAGGDLDVIGRTVILIGHGRNATIINANGNDRAFDNHGGTLIMQHLKIINGVALTTTYGGGGILNRNGSNAKPG